MTIIKFSGTLQFIPDSYDEQEYYIEIGEPDGDTVNLAQEIDKIIWQGPVTVAFASGEFHGDLSVSCGYSAYSEVTGGEYDSLRVGNHDLRQELEGYNGQELTIWVADEPVDLLDEPEGNKILKVWQGANAPELTLLDAKGRPDAVKIARYAQQRLAGVAKVDYDADQGDGKSEINIHVTGSGYVTGFRLSISLDQGQPIGRFIFFSQWWKIDGIAEVVQLLDDEVWHGALRQAVITERDAARRQYPSLEAEGRRLIGWRIGSDENRKGHQILEQAESLKRRASEMQELIDFMGWED